MADDKRSLVDAARAALSADGRLSECTFDEATFALRVVSKQGAFTFFLASLLRRYASAPPDERAVLVSDWAKGVLDRATDPSAIGEMNVVSKVGQDAITYKLPRALPAGLSRLIGVVMMLPFVLLVIVPRVFDVPSVGGAGVVIVSGIVGLSGMYLLRGQTPWLGRHDE
jgi:hypothetical protein